MDDLQTLPLGPDRELSPQQLVAAIDQRAHIALTPAALDAVHQSNLRLNALIEQNHPIYGLTTGYGPLVVHDAHPDPERQGMGLLNHLSAGWGPDAPAKIVRTAMTLRLNTICQGYSGASLQVTQALGALINAPLCPCVPEIGSVGASGDLIPMAHAAMVLAAKGWATMDDGRRLDGAQALAVAGLTPIKLTARDALAVVNGTALMTAYALRALVCAERLHQHAQHLTAWLYRLLGARRQALAPALHQARGHRTQSDVAAQIRAAIAAQPDPGPQQDRPLQEVYSLRCAPQWLGASARHLQYARALIQDEINGVSDNPIIAPGPPAEALHGGNFQGTQIAFAADAINAALVHTAILAERQLDVLVNPDLNNNAPTMLAHTPGTDSGVAGVQITATALLAEMKHHGQPCATASWPTNGRNQDVVSMGTMAARQAWAQTERAAGVLAACALTAAQLNHRRIQGKAQGPTTATPKVLQDHTPFDADQPTRTALHNIAQRLLHIDP